MSDYVGRIGRIIDFGTERQFEDFLSKHGLRIDDLEISRDQDLKTTHVKEFLPDPVYGIKIKIVDVKVGQSSGKTTYVALVPGWSRSA